MAGWNLNNIRKKMRGKIPDRWLDPKYAKKCAMAGWSLKQYATKYAKTYARIRYGWPKPTNMQKIRYGGLEAERMCKKKMKNTP